MGRPPPLQVALGTPSRRVLGTHVHRPHPEQKRISTWDTRGHGVGGRFQGSPGVGTTGGRRHGHTRASEGTACTELDSGEPLTNNRPEERPLAHCHPLLTVPKNARPPGWTGQQRRSGDIGPLGPHISFRPPLSWGPAMGWQLSPRHVWSPASANSPSATGVPTAAPTRHPGPRPSPASLTRCRPRCPCFRPGADAALLPDTQATTGHHGPLRTTTGHHTDSPAGIRAPGAPSSQASRKEGKQSHRRVSPRPVPAATPRRGRRPGPTGLGALGAPPARRCPSSRA